MEKELSNWWIAQIEKLKCEVPLSVIKKKARKDSKNTELFRASKGWLDKFVKRYKIEEKINDLKKKYDL